IKHFKLFFSCYFNIAGNIFMKGNYIMKRAALYERVSTTNQAEEGYSIDAQIDKLTKFAESKDYKIVGHYTDAGYSGSKIDRPNLQNMVNDIKQSKIDIVVVYKLDRLSRSQKDTLHLIDDIFLKNNVEFVSITESFDTSTAYGRAMLGLLSVFAQLERENIRERIKMTFAERARQGLYHGGSSIPAGYYMENGLLKVDKSEAFVVQKVFELYAEGWSCDKIGRYINANYKGMFSFSTKSITGMIKNSIFNQKIKYYDKEYQGIHDRIISQALWDKVQARLKRNSKIVKSGNYTSLLTGIIYCAHCGAKMMAMKGPKLKSGEQHGYYQCYSKRGTPHYMVVDPNCKASKTYRSERIDDYIINELKQLTVDKFAKIVDNIQIDTSTMETEINELDDKINKLIDLYQIDEIPTEVLKVRIAEFSKKKSSLVKAVNEIKDNNLRKKERFALEQQQRIMDLQTFDWNNSTIRDKRKVIYPLINKIEISKTDVFIHWNI
ncbi:recombinase family protein, partial [Melissococcus plutonius]